MIAELLAKSEQHERALPSEMLINESDGMTNVICVSTAKVPIVKIFDPELELACDMNVNNTLALENTRMIKTYVEIDPRVRPLAMIIKHWTKRRIVNDAGKQSHLQLPSASLIPGKLLVVRSVRTLGYA
jgi:DNA polymerase sigma